MESHDTDILRPMSDEQLTVWAGHCRNHWPRTINAHHFLRQHFVWKQKLKEFQPKVISDKCRVAFFTPVSSRPEDCTFVAISGEEDHAIFFHSLEEPPVQLVASLRGTKRIDWSRRIVHSSVDERHRQLLQEIIDEKGLELLFDNPCYYYRLKKESAAAFEINLPPTVQLSRLRKEDVPTVVATWPLSYPGCEVFVDSLIELNYGLGLYCKETNQLLSMVLRNDHGGVGLLQTIDSAKRKGYAALLLKAISKSLAEEEDDDVLVYVIQANELSNRMFQAVGYEMAGKCTWIGTEGKE